MPSASLFSGFRVFGFSLGTTRVTCVTSQPDIGSWLLADRQRVQGVGHRATGTGLAYRSCDLSGHVPFPVGYQEFSQKASHRCLQASVGKMSHEEVMLLQPAPKLLLGGRGVAVLGKSERVEKMGARVTGIPRDEVLARAIISSLPPLGS